jgi:hypothetical protein
VRALVDLRLRVQPGLLLRGEGEARRLQMQNGDAALHAYRLDDPAGITGRASRGASAAFTYATRRFEGGTLTVAALVHRS